MQDCMYSGIFLSKFDAKAKTGGYRIRAIGQKVLMTNPNKPDSYLNDVARSIQLHLPT